MSYLVKFSFGLLSLLLGEQLYLVSSSLVISLTGPFTLPAFVIWLWWLGSVLVFFIPFYLFSQRLIRKL